MYRTKTANERANERATCWAIQRSINGSLNEKSSRQQAPFTRIVRKVIFKRIIMYRWGGGDGHACAGLTWSKERVLYTSKIKSWPMVKRGAPRAPLANYSLNKIVFHPMARRAFYTGSNKSESHLLKCFLSQVIFLNWPIWCRIKSSLKG